jgi:uncharacterized lipoprotein YmbA
MTDDRPSRACIGRRSTARRLLLAASALLLAACAAAPTVHLHTLMPLESVARSPLAGTAAGEAPIVVVETVHVPAQVDQSQWLVRVADGSLLLLEQERWASTPADELREALRETLARRFGAVEPTPATPLDARRWILRVDVSRFESALDRVRLEATWSLVRTPSAAGAVLRCVALLEEPGDGSMNGIAAAHRRAVARLGDAIGERLVALTRGGAGVCPA